MGVTDEIRKLFAEGKTVKDIVTAGYKKPTVYKVNKEIKTKQNFENSDNPDSSDIPGGDGDINPMESEESDPDPDGEGDNDGLNNSSDDEFTESEKSRINDLFGPGDDDIIPFQEYNGISIVRDSSDIVPIVTQTTTNGKPGPCGKLTGISTTIAITEAFELIGILTGEDFWALSPKEQKLIKKLCVLPGIDKYLSKIGVYGCALILIQILFKRIKLELNVKSKDSTNKKSNTSESEQGAIQAVSGQLGTTIKPDDKSTHVLEGLTL